MAAHAAAAVAAASAAAHSSLFSVRGLRVLVTGGSRGIGRMIAEGFVRGGASVLIASRSAEVTARAAAEMSAAAAADCGSGGKCVALPATDLSTPEGCAGLAEAAAAHAPWGGALDVLVNNSGAAWGAPMESFPVAAWTKVMDLNVRAPFLLTAALRGALARGAASRGGAPGRVIMIGSVTGVQAQPFPTYPYDTSKAALHALTRKLSTELAPEITVNALAPGFVPTRMSRGLAAYAVTEADLAAAIPMRRQGGADDMAGAAIFLASRAGAWVTGQILVVDGGQSARPLTMATGMADAGDA